jgi:hypothetical protein
MIQIQHRKSGRVLYRVAGDRLAGANLAFLTLRGADLRGALYDGATRWPLGFSPWYHQCVRVASPTEVVPAPADPGRGDEVTPTEAM